MARAHQTFAKVGVEHRDFSDGKLLVLCTIFLDLDYDVVHLDVIWSWGSSDNSPSAISPLLWGFWLKNQGGSVAAGRVVVFSSFKAAARVGYKREEPLIRAAERGGIS